VNGELLFLAQTRFTALVQRISNCDKIQNTDTDTALTYKHA